MTHMTAVPSRRLRAGFALGAAALVLTGCAGGGGSASSSTAAGSPTAGGAGSSVTSPAASSSAASSSALSLSMPDRFGNEARTGLTEAVTAAAPEGFEVTTRSVSPLERKTDLEDQATILTDGPLEPAAEGSSASPTYTEAQQRCADAAAERFRTEAAAGGAQLRSDAMPTVAGGAYTSVRADVVAYPDASAAVAALADGSAPIELCTDVQVPGAEQPTDIAPVTGIGDEAVGGELAGGRWLAVRRGTDVVSVMVAGPGETAPAGAADQARALAEQVLEAVPAG
ncbi:hypothetical protein MHY29_11475 [Micrococcus sp. ACRRV]|uniref:hypothetical protein n=1 Tax=Micrococcus sp. ACRRV TaxID=2918203 RepID=UPI001EF203DD|nr:hypothetical protein [Micrococcus sp. ACRRV]MCG7423428.1 hypothetical protein [Micrococcus sp. ACRRV]